MQKGWFSVHRNGIPNPSLAATYADCGRLWATLTTEYIPGLRIEMKLAPDGVEAPSLVLELIDYGPCSVDECHWVNVWAKKQFYNQLHLISWGQVFDLLIVGYRQIDDFFQYGEAHAPERRQL